MNIPSTHSSQSGRLPGFLSTTAGRFAAGGSLLLVVALIAGLVAFVGGGSDPEVGLDRPAAEATPSSTVQSVDDGEPPQQTSTSAPDSDSDSDASQTAAESAPAITLSPFVRESTPTTSEPTVEPTPDPTSDPAVEPDTSAPTTTVAPVDEDPETVPANAGEITQQGAITEKPVHDVPPPPAPDWEPEALDPVEAPAPADAFAPADDPVEFDDYPTAPGGFVSNNPGCASDCIVSALIIPKQFQSDLGFELETNVDTLTQVWVRDSEPTVISGVPQVGAWPTAFSVDFAKEWSTNLDGLDFDTTYWVVVRVVDQYDNDRYAWTEWTTIEAPTPGQLVGNGGGCYYQCIEDGWAKPGDTYDTAVLFVKASVPADFDISISPQEPGWIGDSPILPKDEQFEVTEGNSWAVKGLATGLQADTTYHVVVKATDSDGFTAHAIGSFHTDPLPPRVPVPTDVLIGFHRYDIIGDGDPGSNNRGEIELTWGMKAPFEYMGHREEDKIASDTTIVLPADSGRWVSIPDGEMLPNVIGNAAERDWAANDIGQSGCNPGNGLVLYPHNHDACDQLINVAQSGEQPISWLDTLPKCTEFGLNDFRADAVCAVIESPNMGGEFVSFRVVVWFYRD